MALFRIVFVCVVFCSSFLVASKVAEFQNLYIAAVRCNMSEQFTHKNYSCFAKSYSRTFSTLNIITTTKMPLHNIFVSHSIQFKPVHWIHNVQVDAKLLFRYGLVYRDVIRAPRIDVCEMTRRIQDKQDLANRVIFSAFKFIKDSYPEMIHECPYNVPCSQNSIFFLLLSFNS